MKKKNFLIIGILFLIVLIAIAYLLLNYKNIIENSKITNELTNTFVSFLDSDGKKTYFEIFDLESKSIKFKEAIGKTSEIWYGETFIDYSKNIIAVNNSVSGNNDIYLIDATSIKKIGILSSGNGQIIYSNDILYVIHCLDGKAYLKKYNIHDLENPINSFELKGQVQDIKIAGINGIIYIISIDINEEQTYLYSLENDNLQELVLFDYAVSCKLLLAENKIFVSCMDNLVINKQSNEVLKVPINKIYLVFDSKAQEVIRTSSAPCMIAMNDGLIYVVNSTNNSYMEIYDFVTWEFIEKNDLDIGQIYGIHSSNNSLYVMGQNGIREYNKLKSKLIYQTNNHNQNITMKIN